MLRRSLRVVKGCQWLYYTNLIKFHSSASFILCTKFDKNLPSPKIPTPVDKLYGPDRDILLDQLKKATTVDRVFELVNLHLDVMNSKHVVTCLEIIHDCTKSDLQSSKALQENESFQALCSRLMKVVRLFEPCDLITTYKVLTGLQIRNNTYVMQCVLRMLGAHINNMSLGQLVFLNFLLNKQRHNNLVDGLKLAIPLVIQVQIDQQLDSDNMTEVANCLQIACTSRLKPAVIEKVMSFVLRKVAALTPDSALTVALSLLNLDTPVDGYKELLTATFDILTKSIDELNTNKILVLFRTCNSQRYYHSNFFFAAANHIVSKQWNLETTYSVICCFSRLDFYPSNLLDHFSSMLCSESNNYQTNHFYSPLTCIEYLTATSYRPVNVDEAARVLYSSEEKLNNLMSKHPHLMLKFLSCLAMLGHFPPNLLTKILNEDELFSSWSSSRKQGKNIEFERNLLALSYGLELYNEEKNFIIPSIVLNKCIQGVHQRNLNAEYPLVKFIESGLGGPQFVRSGVFTHDGHVIDHIVAMRSGNYPVSLQNLKSSKEKPLQQLFVEDIILPDDAKIIAVIVAKQEQFCRDPELLKGRMDLIIRHLKKKHFSTVVINYSKWKDFPDREKIPFLMREIKEAITEDCVLKSTSS